MGMSVRLSNKVVRESSRDIKVCNEADVVVVGGGPAGIAAALTASRNGMETVLVERYGHLGGMATGGMVILLPHMSAGTEVQEIGGLCQEIIDRLDLLNGALHPKKEELGSNEERVVRRWERYNPFFVIEGRVRFSALVDAEILKCVLYDMMGETGVKLYCHSWGSQAIMEKDAVQGVIVEGKSGRQAILGKLVIDATGDGDIFASAGAEFDGAIDPALRSSNLALVFRVGNIDAERFSRFKSQDHDQYLQQMKEVEQLGGFSVCLPTSRDDVRYFNNWLPGLSALSVEDLTWVEVNARKKMLITYNFFKRNVPGFEKSFIVDTASQVGTRGSRRLIGRHVVTGREVREGVIHRDSIAVIPPTRHNLSAEHPNAYIPYRSLVPRGVENLLVAGRCFSSDAAANDRLNLIPHCVAMGQAAGTAAAMAIKDGVSLADVDYAVLQDHLIDQNIPLPGIRD